MTDKQNNKELEEIREESFEEIQTTPGWEIVLKLASDIRKDVCNLESVPLDLSPIEYKIECAARTKAKSMFNRIFRDVDSKTERTNKKKIKYT